VEISQECLRTKSWLLWLPYAKKENYDASHSGNDFHVIINLESKVMYTKLPEYYLSFEDSLHVTEDETHLLLYCGTFNKIR
jgi:hypothetical protein